MPRYITAIKGYSPSRGRMYFTDKKDRAILSTLDAARTLQLTSKIPGDVIKPVSVSGKTLLSDVIWSGTKDYSGEHFVFPFFISMLHLLRRAIGPKIKYTTFFFNLTANADGLFYKDELLVQWKSCCS